ncbi:hypothetical protein O9992_05260 [Vibrio lentus]|nr:hypothetical protein [Vibrio lentus]
MSLGYISRKSTPLILGKKLGILMTAGSDVPVRNFLRQTSVELDGKMDFFNSTVIDSCSMSEDAPMDTRYIYSFKSENGKMRKFLKFVARGKS